MYVNFHILNFNVSMHICCANTSDAQICILIYINHICEKCKQEKTCVPLNE